MSFLKDLYHRVMPQKMRSEMFVARQALAWLLAGQTGCGTEHRLPGELVVSLTSFPPRYPRLHLTLRSLVNQTVRPDRIVVWYQGGTLSKATLKLMAYGVEFHEADPALRSYNKIIPSLKRWPEAFIVTVDDDIIYPPTMIEELVSGYRSDHEILFRRGHKITFNAAGRPNAYEDWEWETKDVGPSPDLVSTGAGGALYAPGALHADVIRVDQFREICPTTDDLWLYTMARRNGCTYRRVGSSDLLVWPGSEQVSLAIANAKVEGGNSTQLKRLVERYGFPPA